MNELLALVLTGSTGVLLGAVFFGGLWWTVQKGVVSAHPALWFLSSLVLRLSLVMAGFYFVGQGDWRRWTVCLVGFLIARILVTRGSADFAKEAPRAS
ncbi:MAG: ATP synthase subunit I [Kiritimatiellia bacterium]